MEGLAPDAASLAIAVILDAAIGDPSYAWHPIRLIGALLTATERFLRRIGLDGYGGGIVSFIVLATASVASVAAAVAAATFWLSPLVARAIHVYVVYSLLALGDLVRHVWRIEQALRRGTLDDAHVHVSALVGRDTDVMDAAACRRAAVESLSENLTDGFVSPLCWYAVAGLPGLVVFKVVSTMDSMVGYKTPLYLRFGWCGARLDDVMNYLPARLTWLTIVAIATLLPTFSGAKAWRVGLRQHALIPGPNAGWSEAAIAGALQRKIAGPIWRGGIQVTDLWIGDPGDAVLESSTDVVRAISIVVTCGWLVAAVAIVVLASPIF